MYLNFLPLALAITVCLVIIGTRIDKRVNRIVTRVSLLTFGRYSVVYSRHQGERLEALRAAHVPTTYRVYAAKTLLYSAIFALAGSVFGVYLLAGLFWLLAIEPTTLTNVLPQSLHFLTNLLEVPTLQFTQLVGLVVVSSVTVGAFCGIFMYTFRWWWPVNVAANRRRRIDASMTRTVAFIYALSRSGMAFPQVMRVFADNRTVYGDAADEISVAVNDMDVFGADVITAIQRMGHRTPSEQFQEFSENLASVLQSGQSLSTFLRNQYDRYHEEIEAQQTQLLNLLSTLAEFYVTVLVAGPLFLITILVIIGIAVSDTLRLVQITVYFILPLANLVFIVYLSTITESLRTVRDRPVPEDPLGGVANVRRIRDATERDVVTDGGVSSNANVERLDAYERYRSFLHHVSQPIETLLKRPTVLLYFTIPVAVIVMAIRIPGTFEDGAIALHLLDDVIVQATLFVIGTYAIVEEIRQRRLRRIEAIVPDFLDRLASVNEAGMTVVESVGRVRISDLGVLNPEIERIWRDIEWGADLESALRRFERRVQTMSITRIVTLITNAIAASGDVAPVLRIAAEQSQADRRLKRHRNQEMFTYLVVIYVSFFVFLVIIFALNNVLIPSLPHALPGEQVEDAASGVLAGLADIDPDAYTLVFFHTVLLQGTLSGFIAGQMGGGSLRDGAKHAAILLTVAYVGFLLIG